MCEEFKQSNAAAMIRELAGRLPLRLPNGIASRSTPRWTGPHPALRRFTPSTMAHVQSSGGENTNRLAHEESPYLLQVRPPAARRRPPPRRWRLALTAPALP